MTDTALGYFRVTTTPIVGRKYHAEINAAEVGDKLHLVREPENAFDKNAIAVHHIEDGKLGHLAASLARVLAPMIDHGYKFRARLLDVGDDCEISLRMQEKRPA